MANGIKLEPHENEILEKTLIYANKITSNYFIAKDKEMLIKFW